MSENQGRKCYYSLFQYCPQNGLDERFTIGMVLFLTDGDGNIREVWGTHPPNCRYVRIAKYLGFVGDGFGQMLDVVRRNLDRCYHIDTLPEVTDPGHNANEVRWTEPRWCKGSTMEEAKQSCAVMIEQLTDTTGGDQMTEDMTQATYNKPTGGGRMTEETSDRATSIESATIDALAGQIKAIDNSVRRLEQLARSKTEIDDTNYLERRIHQLEVEMLHHLHRIPQTTPQNAPEWWRPGEHTASLHMAATARNVEEVSE